MPDVPGDSSTTSNVTVGSVVAGSIETASDHDWFRIELVAGQSITISLDGTGASPLSDPYLRIIDSMGTLLAQNDDGGPGLNSLLSFTATTAGTYYIDASAWSTELGDYTLSVNPFTPPPVATIPQFAYQLTNGYWDGSSHHFNVTQGGSLTVNLTALTTAGQNLARLALHQWSDLIGVNFVEVANGGQITFDDNQDGAFSSAQYSRGITASAIVNVSTQWLTDYGTTINSYGYQSYVHEIGHALGLGHAGNYNETADYPTDALFQNDAWSMSVMSYFSQTENSYFSNQGFTRSYVGTPMLADIAAVSVLYGLSTTTRAGATTYGFNSNAGDVYNANLYPTLAYTVFDSGGTDTLDYSGFSANQRIDLTAGQFSNVGGRTGNVAIALGTVIENAIGGSGNDTIIGNAVANVLTGGGGNDVFTGAAGNDTINGGSGMDTSVYAGLFRSYTANVVSGAGTVAGGAEGGTDNLSSIEYLHFQDGTLVFDPTGVAAQVMRLYDTALQRGPDQAGLDFYVDQIEDRGGVLKQVANNFLNSPEFQAATGSLSNADYVEYLYQHALHRASDPDGKSFFVNRLNSGSSDRADLLISFSESQEHRTATAGLVDHGFFNTDDNYQAVALLYDSFAGRMPDAGGLVYWSELLRSGTLSLDQVADRFADSPEFHHSTDGMSNAQLVNFMYQNTLDRPADPAGLQYWTQRLDAGMDHGDLLIGFSQSNEHFTLIGAHVTNGIDYL